MFCYWCCDQRCVHSANNNSNSAAKDKNKRLIVIMKKARKIICAKRFCAYKSHWILKGFSVKIRNYISNFLLWTNVSSGPMWLCQWHWSIGTDFVALYSLLVLLATFSLTDLRFNRIFYVSAISSTSST